MLLGRQTILLFNNHLVGRQTQVKLSLLKGLCKNSVSLILGPVETHSTQLGTPGREERQMNADIRDAHKRYMLQQLLAFLCCSCA